MIGLIDIYFDSCIVLLKFCNSVGLVYIIDCMFWAVGFYVLFGIFLLWILFKDWRGEGLNFFGVVWFKFFLLKENLWILKILFSLIGNWKLSM